MMGVGGYVKPGEIYRLGLADEGYLLPPTMVRQIQMEGLTEGRIVHFVLASGPCEGEHRPAMVVRVKRNDEGIADPAGVCDLRVFTRGMELDGYPDVDLRTGITFSEQPLFHTWHWIERA